MSIASPAATVRILSNLAAEQADILVKRLSYAEMLLAEATTPAEAVKTYKLAEAARVYAYNVGAAPPLINRAVVLKLKARRKMGDLMDKERALQRSGPGAFSKLLQRGRRLLQRGARALKRNLIASLLFAILCVLVGFLVLAFYCANWQFHIFARHLPRGSRIELHLDSY
jgi:hypothetical protein